MLAMCLAVRAPAQAVMTNLFDATNKFSWSENSGWHIWKNANAGASVLVNADNSGYLSGYAWGENIGWISLGAASGGPYANTAENNYGVNMEPDGRLSGFAWSESAGWLKFSNTCAGATYQVSVNTNSGSFDGYAWGENIGWVHFKNASPAYNVSMYRQAQVVLTNLSWPYDGAAHWAAASTVPEGLAVRFTYNGSTSAPVNVGSYAVTGRVEDVLYQGAASGILTIGKGAGAVTLTGTNQTYTGFPCPAGATTVPAGLAVDLTYDGMSGAPTNPGSYTVAGVINDASYQGAGTGTLVIGKMAATVTISNLNQTYNGSARPVTASTEPSGLAVDITYDGSSSAPAAPGSYAVAAQVNDPFYQGSAAGTLTIGKIAAAVSLGSLSQAYDGSARPVTASTDPSGLTVDVTYDGHAWAPTNPGTYAVAAAVNEPNYEGSAAGTLEIYFTAPVASQGAYQDRVFVYWGALASATSYELWRGTVNDPARAALILSSTATLYNDTSVTPDVAYYYWIRALTPQGIIGFSLPATGYCGTIGNLSSPAGFSASDGTYNGRVMLSWQAVTGAASYEVWRGASEDIGSASLLASTASASCEDGSASPGIRYYYWAKARTATRDGDFSLPDAGWSRLENPAGVSATDAACRYRVSVTWSAVQNASSYELWREDVPGEFSPGGNLVLLARTGQVAYDDYDTRSGVYYSYKVKAFNDISSSPDYGSDTGHRQVNAAAGARRALNDFDGDGLSDLALYQPASGAFAILSSALGRIAFAAGYEQSSGVAGDYDGDGKADPVGYSPADGSWQAMLSALGYSPVFSALFGGNGALPLAADFDGDNLFDLAVYDAAGGRLAALFSNGGAFNMTAACSIGAPGWTGVAGDFDGDGLCDPAVYSGAEGRMRVMFSGSGYASASAAIGSAGETMQAADFDGDGKADPVLYAGATGLWTVLLSGANYAIGRVSLGGTDFLAVPGDYDGDGLSDPAVYREADGQWLIMLSTASYAVTAEKFGGPGSQPLAR